MVLGRSQCGSPSLLVMMGKVLAPECLGQHALQVCDPLGGEELETLRGELVEQLSAPAAGHDDLAGAVDAGERCDLPAPGQLQLSHQGAFGAEPDAVGSLLQVAAGNQAPIY